MSFLTRSLSAAALVASLAFAASTANAQTPAAMAAARELTSITGATGLLNPLIPGVIEQAKLLYLQQNPALSKDLNEVAAKLRADLSPRFSELSDAVARAYAARFSEQELKEVVAFYKTPAGAKLLTEQPQIIDDSMKFAQTWSNALSDEVMGKIRDEMKKRGHNM